MKINSVVQKQYGFSLLEVLIAVVILSVGLLGLAGLQVVSLKNTKNSFFRSQAVFMANDMADMVRANRYAIENGEVTGAAKIATANCRTATGCTTSQMVNDSYWFWDQAIATNLPGGVGFVCKHSNPAALGFGCDPNAAAPAPSPNCDAAGDLYIVRVCWDERVDINDDVDDGVIDGIETKQYTITMQL